MDKVNYLEIFKKSWRITWHHKYLWWLGVFAGSGGAASFNFPADFPNEPGHDAWTDKIASFTETHLALILGAVIALIILALILGLLKIWTFSSLIRSIAGIEKGDVKNIPEALAEGKRFFSRILAIRILLALSVLALLLVLILPVAFLFSVHSLILGTITALMAFLILIPSIISLSFISHYGSFYVIASDLPLKYALEQGYKIFAKNIGASILMSLLFIPVNIVAGIIFLLPLAALGIIFGILGLASYWLFSAWGAWTIGILAGILFLLLLLLFRSVMSVFYNAAWFLFFRSISAIPEEEVPAGEELLLQETIQPEKA